MPDSEQLHKDLGYLQGELSGIKLIVTTGFAELKDAVTKGFANEAAERAKLETRVTELEKRQNWAMGIGAAVIFAMQIIDLSPIFK